MTPATQVQQEELVRRVTKAPCGRMGPVFR
jgi:hypothetical protein